MHYVEIDTLFINIVENAIQVIVSLVLIPWSDNFLPPALCKMAALKIRVNR